MREFKRFARALAVFFAVIALIIVAGLWFFDAIGVSRPSHENLTAYFQTHRAAFEQLKNLALTNEGKVGILIETDDLDEQPFDVTRRRKYAEGLKQISRCALIGADKFEIKFICSGGGFSAISREWAKGVAFLPDGPRHVGEVVKSLDSITAQDDEFLKSIGGGWYLFYEDID